MDNYAPILLFVYNRPSHTKQTVDRLIQNTLSEKSNLIIYSDGPKNSEDIVKVKEVRELIKTIKGFKSISLIPQESNLGLSNSIIKGVTETLKKFEKVIVLEDDLLTSKYFLEFMNEGLQLFKDEDKVASIHGYVYPLNSNKINQPFFIKGADCWGWATWKNKWKILNTDGSELLKKLSNSGQKKEFNFRNNYNYFKMLEDQVLGKNDSWAIRWHASAFLENKLTLYPPISLVHNIGNDNSGFHSGNTTIYDTELKDERIYLNKIPVEESTEAKEAFEIFFKSSKERKYKQIIKKIACFLKNN